MTTSKEDFCPRWVTGLAIVVLAIGMVSVTSAEGGLPDDPVVRQDILSEVQALYDITEQQAVNRLAAEMQAAELNRLVGHLAIEGYAGTWFDPQTRQLNVATSSSTDAVLIERLGATSVEVPRSLGELRAIRTRIESLLQANFGAEDMIRQTYVDYRLNQVVIGTGADHLAEVQAALAAQELDPRSVKVVLAKQVTFSASLRGADPMCNYTYTKPPHNFPTCHAHPCSVGASVVGGYVTAGHCGETGNRIHTDPASGAGQLLGTVAGSTMTYTPYGYAFAHNEDGSWVDTASGWNPKPQIDNYGPGAFYVSAKWSGILEAPVGTTVCRFGQTTSPDNDGVPGSDPDHVEGADCGRVMAKNVTIYGGYISELNGMTKTSDICSKDGDSGGPVVTPTGQVQGTFSAHAQGYDCSDTPSPGEPDNIVDTAYFQPIGTTLGRSDQTMLTTHGANKPTINGFDCPSNPNNVGGPFFCNFDSFDSQGETEILWTVTGGSQTSTSRSFGPVLCPKPGRAFVNLTVSNPYGTTQRMVHFDCSGGPPF